MTPYTSHPRWQRAGLLAVLFIVSLASAFSHLLTSPPGINGDAARMGIHAWDYLTRGIRPFYIFHQFAPNPLLVLLQIPVFAVLGSSMASLRGITAFAGALSAPLAFWAASELFHHQGEAFARRAGLIAGLGLALSPSFAAFNRYGFETALLPPLQLLALAALCRGLRLESRPWLITAGVVVGLSQYSYIVARAFPVALVAALLLAFLSGTRLPAKRWRGLAWTGLATALVAGPQWYLFVSEPYTLVARTQAAVSPLQLGLLESLWVLAVKAAHQVVALTWHWNNGYDLFSGRPVLTLPLAAGLVTVVAAAVRRSNVSCRFILVVTAIMLVPDLLVDEGLWPQATRMSSAVAPVYLAAAGGVAIIWACLERFPSLTRRAGLLLVALVVLAGGEAQIDRWRRVIPVAQASEDLEWKAGLIEIAEAEYLKGLEGDEAALIPSSEYQRPEMAFLLSETFPERAGGLPLPLEPGEKVRVVLPAAPERPSSDARPSGYLEDQWVALKDGVAYFLPPLSEPFQPTSVPRPILAGNDALAATTFTGTWSGEMRGATPTVAGFSNGLRLVGYQLTEFAPGRVLTVTLYLKTERVLSADVQLFVQVLDQGQNGVAGITDWPLHGVYRARAWRPGEVVPLTYELEIPPGLAPGPYRLTLGVIDVIRQERVPLANGEDTFTVATLKVPLPPHTAGPEHLSGARFGEDIILDGYTLASDGARLSVRLFWRATAVPSEDYIVFAHVVDQAGHLVAQSDAEPAGGQYPTSIWDAGEPVVDEHVVAAPAGDYQVRVGLYSWPSLERLTAVVEGTPVPDNALTLDP